MSDSLRKAIEEMQADLQIKLNEVAELKQGINTLCKVMRVPPIYADVEAESASGSIGPLRPDIYYGKQLATAAREYLEYRKQALKAEDILNALEQGGFDFDGLDWTEQNRLRNLSISLAKNTVTFRRLPNGMFGLESWYEDKVKRKTKKRGGKVETGSTDDTAEPEITDMTNDLPALPA